MPPERRARRSQACEGCRSQKLACKAGIDDNDGPCERCHRMNRTCVPHIPKPYIERKQQSKSKIDANESRPGVSEDMRSRGSLDHILHNETQTETPESLQLGPWRDGNPLEFGKYLYEKLNLLPEVDSEHLPIFSRLSWQKSELLVMQYRAMSKQWPFVILTEDYGSPFLSRNRPFVLLAVCVVTSAYDKEFERAAVHIFRHALATKVIMNGERSLELLQGLLIFLAWHHHYIRQATEQIYQFLQLAMGMVVDLGLCDPKYIGKRRGSEEVEANVALQSLKTQTLDIEAKRALLGCYYLSCGYVIWGFNRPQTLVYSDHFLQCAKDVAKQGTSMDSHLPLMVELFHHVENIRSLFDGQNNAHFDILQKSALRELRAVKDSWSSVSGDIPAWLESTYLYSHVYLAECSKSDQEKGPYSFEQSMKLVSSIDSVTLFLDFFLQNRVNDLPNSAIVEWIQVATAINTMCRTIGELRQTAIDPNDRMRDFCVDAYTDAAVNYIDVLQRRMSDPSMVSRKLVWFKWFCNITSILKKRLLASSPSRNTFPSNHRSAFEASSELTRETERPISSDVDMDDGAMASLVTPESLTETDGLADVNFDQNVWPFVGWFSNYASY